jgi:hypothetical protein
MITMTITIFMIMTLMGMMVMATTVVVGVMMTMFEGNDSYRMPMMMPPMTM